MYQIPTKKITDPAAKAKLSQYQLSENTAMLYLYRQRGIFSRNDYNVLIDGKHAVNFYKEKPGSEYYAVALNLGWHEFSCYNPETYKKTKEIQQFLIFFIKAKDQKVITFANCANRKNYESLFHPPTLHLFPYQKPKYINLNKYRSKLTGKALIKFVSLVNTQKWASSGKKAAYKKEVVNVARSERLAAEKKRLEEKIRKDTALAIKNTMERDGTKSLIDDAAKLSYYCDYLPKEKANITRVSCSYEDYTTEDLRVRTSYECLSLKKKTVKRVEEDIKGVCQLKDQTLSQLTQIYGQQSKAAIEDVLAERQRIGYYNPEDDFPHANRFGLVRLIEPSKRG